MTREYVTKPNAHQDKLVPTATALKKVADGFDRARRQAMEKRSKAATRLDFVKV